MINLQKLRKSCILKWVFSYSCNNYFRSSRTILCPIESHHIAQSLRFFGNKVAGESEISEKVSQLSAAARKDAQAALLEYLHSTRSLQFMDAEHMSKNSPHFLEKLVEKVGNKGEIGRSLTRFLRYHPINEFEPFFESIGLRPSECNSFLPRELMFLNDDPYLLENYNVLCNYGIARNKIGKIYRGAPEAFRYGNAVLHSKLKSLENQGLDQTKVIKLVTSSPNVLVGDVSTDFFKVLEKLRSIRIVYEWVQGHLLGGDSYNWRSVLELLCLFSKIGCTDEQLRRLIHQHPELLFSASGHLSFSLIAFLMKFGCTPNEICTVFLQFPEIPVGKFVANLRNCYMFLIGIEMAYPDIQNILCSHALLLGSCSLKKVNSLLGSLSIGKKRMCKIIKEDPEVLKNWVFGKKVERLPISEEELQSQLMKTKFLLDLGFAENSKEMKRALKVFRGKGKELQERFDCLVNAGLDPKDVSAMVKVSPHILNQSKDVIETKINYLVHGLGYPLSVLKKFPSFINYTIQRVKLRISMYNWLKDVGAADPKLALSTLLACSEKIFLRTYVNSHPKGPEVWESLKKKICSV